MRSAIAPLSILTRLRSISLASLVGLFMCLALPSARGELRIQDICRLKGQEENTLQGIGLVVGLKGTGDGDFKPTVRSAAQALKGLGGNPSIDLQGRLNDKELANTKNIAMVLVTATIPPAGAMQGDKVTCSVSALHAKSLEGGNLILTHMLGPRADQAMTFGLASGPIVIDDPKIPTAGRISSGCKMEVSVNNPFVENNRITLILEPSHSSFASAALITDKINRYDEQGGVGGGSGSNFSAGRSTKKIATAIDQSHVVIEIPSVYKDNPVEFVSMILSLPLVNVSNNKRVYIQEREGVVIIGEDVTIAPVAISYGTLSISPKAGAGPTDPFVPLSTKEDQTQPKLKNLVDALNILKVPTSDVITIIKGIQRQGNLYGELVIE